MKRTLMSSSAKQGLGRHVGRGDRPKRIVILSQFYTPEPHRIASTIANTLAERGYEISVVTGYPNRPEGKLYPGYKQRLRFTEIINGIPVQDRKSTRLNSSHVAISYAVFCLQKKNSI